MLLNDWTCYVLQNTGGSREYSRKEDPASDGWELETETCLVGVWYYEVQINRGNIVWQVTYLTWEYSVLYSEGGPGLKSQSNSDYFDGSFLFCFSPVLPCKWWESAQK